MSDVKRVRDFPGRRAERGAGVPGYGLAVLLVLLATGVRWLLDPFVGESVPYVTYFLASAVAIRFTGLGPSILAIVLGTLVATWLFVPPRGAVPTDLAQLLSIGVFLAANLIVLALAQAMRRAKVQAEANARTALEQKKELERLLAERARAQDKLRESEQRLRASFDNAAMGLAEVDADDQFIAVNDRACQILGFSREELLRLNIHDLTAPEDRAHSDQLNADLHAGRRDRIAYEKRYLKRDGSPLWVYVTASAIRDAQGRWLRSIATIEDISERKRAEDALRRRAEEIERLLEVVPAAVWVAYDPQSRVITGNRLANEFYESAPGENVSASTLPEARRFFASDGRELAPGELPMQFAAATNQELRDVELRVQLPSGQHRTILGSAIPLRNERGEARGCIGAFLDITERKRVEAEIRHSRRLLAEAEALAHTGAWEWNLATDQWTFSDEWLSIHGCRNRRLTPDQLLSIAHPEDRAAIARALENVRHGVAPYDLEHRIVRQDDGSVRVLHARGRFVRDAAGTVVKVYGFAQDITEQREAREVLARSKEELERLVQERTAKLRELVGELEHFSYTITHDMRAPLRAMQGFAQLMLEGGCAECANRMARDYLGRIVTAARRMDALITDALQYNRAVRTELALEPVEVPPLLRGMIDSYPNFQSPHADIALEGNFPPVLGNSAALTQCFSNLLGNAVKYVAPGTKPRVRIWAEEVPNVRNVERRMSNVEWGTQPVHHPPSTPQPSTLSGAECAVRIWFEDNGIGIPPESQGRIFDMFYRGHATHEGTGIGLALVRKNAERMGGKVGVESEPGRGSRFWIELQKAVAAADEPS